MYARILLILLAPKKLKRSYNILLHIYADMFLKFYFIQIVNMYSISKSKTTLVL